MTDDFSHHPPVMARVCRELYDLRNELFAAGQTAKSLQMLATEFPERVNYGTKCEHITARLKRIDAALDAARQRQTVPKADMEAAREIAEAITYGTIPTTREITERIAAALAKEREKCALECERLYAQEREAVNKAATNDDLPSYRLHKRRGDGFFESAQAIRALNGGTPQPRSCLKPIR